jgi:hypothetical protein
MKRSRLSCFTTARDEVSNGVYSEASLDSGR